MPRTLRSPRQKALIALLIEQRKQSGLTQAQLAKRLRRYQSFVATVESGQRRIDVIEFLDLADAIGFDPIDAIKKLRASARPQ
ncbi:MULTISPECIES: helix-turn-helix transcriptional regulator [unclassified Bradyrhizobium]|uniref:helix-turn-helix domain-containing protein n=1 Tax=unclassified Bradyrhizobium TaxID=2631580 RepID=UPI001BA7CDFF|nr:MULTISPECIES: helix-turn-helix transcriptional regulator [unclassified Bradyrhizobium]MBR1208167.1 helix-turn-helix transcriptional regulator [Bradyrhizobium sp. AUGA SZCCT0124]MBR1316424.1 helix-turn-helix transcriptional regulator [Bradyrhizobium sp. AUGA SZCCT0051]MBR1344681.1 helix-turn-helix transcriptional regulator [Bradyrhizobium sp. AUGA SZCCT0105]MBR1359445.1 helix-turn-helix transcriptional regulator [Bradyrhizobium sp. AUGA SZCCT0045]